MKTNILKEFLRIIINEIYKSCLKIENQ